MTLVAAAALALVTGTLAVWRGRRIWIALAVLVAVLDLAFAWLVAYELERHTDGTRMAMGAGLVAIIALLIRFGLAPATSGLVTERLPGDDDPS